MADPRRGQGHYRRLWAEVTKVGRGQKLGDGDGSFPDSSVEDMLQVVRGLAPDASAIAAISQGLYYLDRYTDPRQFKAFSSCSNILKAV